MTRVGMPGPLTYLLVVNRHLEPVIDAGCHAKTRTGRSREGVAIVRNAIQRWSDRPRGRMFHGKRQDTTRAAHNPTVMAGFAVPVRSAPSGTHKTAPARMARVGAVRAPRLTALASKVDLTGGIGTAPASGRISPGVRPDRQSVVPEGTMSAVVNHYPLLSVNLSGFAQYVTVSGPRRVGLAREFTHQATSKYDPRTDHYGAIRRAVVSGSVGGQLDERLQLAVDNASGSRALTYPRLAANYRHWYERMGLAEAKIRKQEARTWPDGGIIRVNPLLAARFPEGRGVLLIVHWKTAPLADDAVTAMLRLAQLAYLDQPELTPVLLDVQRGLHHTPSRQHADYDEWLRSEAASLATLLGRLAQTA